MRGPFAVLAALALGALLALGGARGAEATSWVAFGDSSPAWSPDGTRSAFESSLRGSRGPDAPALYVARADASRPVQVAGDASTPAWSPDGRQLAFASGSGRQAACGQGGCGPIICCRPPTAILAMGAEGTPTRVVAAPPGYNRDPAWSSDGRRIAFSNLRDRTTLYVVEVDGSGLTALTSDDATEWDPAWSPDGRQLAFARTTPGGRAAVYVMRPDGSGRRRVTDQQGWDPAWSPDGTRIAFSNDRGIFVVNADGAGLRRLTGDGSDPAWSPDGRRIAFSSTHGSEDVLPMTIRLFVVNADGTGRAVLTDPRVLSASLATVPGRPRVGRVLAARLTLEPARPVSSADVRCEARLPRAPLPLVSRSGGEGTATCRWRVPRTASGKRIVGFVGVTGVVTHRFARRAR
ncbi:MAG: PD40 domain-containing protein [Thermoleophilia bacterium]|nr:PD40 domain-containing protein [Thermoleophilia bacterium]